MLWWIFILILILHLKMLIWLHVIVEIYVLVLNRLRVINNFTARTELLWMILSKTYVFIFKLRRCSFGSFLLGHLSLLKKSIHYFRSILFTLLAWSLRGHIVVVLVCKRSALVLFLVSKLIWILHLIILARCSFIWLVIDVVLRAQLINSFVKTVRFL